MVAFVSASAHATRDELSAQAATDMHCNSVAIIQSSETQFLATGCGQDRTYTCADDGTCTLESDGSHVHVSGESSGGDDEAAEAIAESIMELGCACASAAMTHHGGHHGGSGKAHGGHK
jgi:hypothetical protein